MKKYLFYIIFFNIFSISPLFAVSINEIQELNLAKAELAILDGHQTEAYRLIKKNLLSKHFHLESFLFLANLHYKEKKFLQSFRVYQYMIKKIYRGYGKKIVSLKLSKLKSILKKFPPPPEDLPPLLYDLANKYLEVANSEYFKQEKVKNNIYDLAYKYFKITHHYKYNLSYTNYNIGIIEGKRNHFDKAIKHYIAAKSIFEESQNISGTQNINYLLGETLLRSGKLNAGSLFLKSLYLSQKVSPALKSYAKQYLDEIGEPQTNYYLSYGVTHNNNPHDLTSNELTNFDSEIYDYKSVNLTQLQISTFHSSKRLQKYWSYTSSLSFSDSKALTEVAKDSDSRTLSGGINLIYNNLIKSTAKIDYIYSHSWYRPEIKSDLKTLSSTHIITPKYQHTLKRGVIEYQIPLTFKKSLTTGHTFSKGIILTYTPFLSSVMFFPNITLFTNSIDEGPQASPSTQFGLSSNAHFSLSDHNSFFTDIEYLINKNEQATNQYKELTISGSFSHLFSFYDKLSVNATVNHTFTDQESAEAINVQTYSIALALSF